MVPSSLTRIGLLAAVPIVPLMYRENRRANRKWTFSKRKPLVEVLSSPNYSNLTRWYRLVRPAIFSMTPDPETAHKMAVFSGFFFGEVLSTISAINRLIRTSMISVSNYFFGPSVLPRRAKRANVNSRLFSTVGGLSLNLPIGVSAGFDKNGEMVNFFLHNNFSIGFAEIGSVSFLPWSGNPRPRVFRLPEDNAIINRMGLNNHGIDTLSKRLENSDLTVRCVGCAGNPCGVNITKTPDASIEGIAAVEDFAKSFSAIVKMKNVKWITLNISCPNTAEGKTFEDISALGSLLESVTNIDRQGKKLFLKLAPITSDWKPKAREIFRLVKQFGVDAIIVANTVPDRDVHLKSHPRLLAERGGLSGPPIFERSIPLVRFAAQEGVDVIAVGGISSGKDVYRLMRNGARAVQLYTAMVYDGPGVFVDLANGLERELIIQGYKNVEDIIGKDL